MNSVKVSTGLALATAGLVLASCSSLPDDPGLYAVNESGDVQRLSGGPKWDRKTWEDRSDLPGKLRFFIVEKGIADDTSVLAEKIKLRRAGWVRSDIEANGAIGPARGVQWVAADIPALDIPLTYDHLGKHDDIIAAAPRGPLEEGLYVIELASGDISVMARFGVNWTRLDKSRYAANNCIDRYDSNGKSAYRRCADQQRVLATQGLQLHMVEPERRIIAGQPAIVVKGVVLNSSESRRAVPMLEGRLIDAAGRAVRDWRFSATTNEVEPGKSVSFGAVVEGAPDNVANVVVRFADSNPEAELQ